MQLPLPRALRRNEALSRGLPGPGRTASAPSATSVFSAAAVHAARPLPCRDLRSAPRRRALQERRGSPVTAAASPLPPFSGGSRPAPRAHARSGTPPCHSPPHWRRGSTNERGRCWRTMRAAVWNTRAALLYSLGGWSMLGAVIHYSRTSGGGVEGGGQPGTG